MSIDTFSIHFQFSCVQVTLSENVHKFVELSQRIVVEKSVIQSCYEEQQQIIQNKNSKTMEFSVKNYRTVSTSSSSSTKATTPTITSGPTQTIISKITPATAGSATQIQQQTAFMLNDTNHLTNNGDTAMDNSETFVDETTNGGECMSPSSNGSVIDEKTNNILGSDTLINSTTKLPEVMVQRPLKPQSEMDFSVPYNIINNYFSVGVVSSISLIKLI